MKTTFLIQACYGFEGIIRDTSYRALQSGIGLWTIEHDGTPESLHSGFIEAQNKSDHVKAFAKACSELQISENLGTWRVFSVVKEFETVYDR